MSDNLLIDEPDRAGQIQTADNFGRRHGQRSYAGALSIWHRFLLQNNPALLEQPGHHLGESSPAWNARLSPMISPSAVSPAVQEFIDGLSSAVQDPAFKDMWTECVCTEEYSEEHPAVRLSCKHVLGKSCIEKWRKSSNQGAEIKCTYCRRQLF